jgi:hypothetical protein
LFIVEDRYGAAKRARTSTSRHFSVTSTLRSTAPEEDEAGERRRSTGRQVILLLLLLLEKTIAKKSR